MIKKTECLELLFDLKDRGVECSKEIKHLLSLVEPDIDTLKFLNSHRELSLQQFYEKLRKSYNDGHSKLYINIVKEYTEEDTTYDILCTLASLQLQLLLFNKTLDDSSFLSSARFEDISKVMLLYYNTKDIIPGKKLLSIIKSDLKVFEQLKDTK